MNIFGERLHLLRLEKGVTLRELAETLNMSYSALGNYERGVREPNMEILRKIAYYFDVSLDYLLGRCDDPKIITMTDVLYGASFSPQRQLANLIEGLTDEERYAAISYIKYLISQRTNKPQEGYTD